ncbi:hypothetical protein vseg_012643 [Gypsophila vaccaria]
MFTGKRPTDDMVGEGRSLRQCLEAALPERLMEILDPVLIQELEMKQGPGRSVSNNDHSGDPWNPNAETVSKVMAMLHGIHRVLKPDGIFISISFGQPHFRRPIFEAPDFTWSMKCNTFGDGFHYFFYTLKKGTRSSISEQPNEKLNSPSICLLQDELEGEDYIFRTNLGDSEED